MIACNDGRCTLQGPININNVMALLAQGSGLFTAPQMTLDLSAVTEVDSSAVSLLLEWARAGLDKGQPLRFINLPTNLTSLAQLYGVTDLIFQPADS